MASSPSFAVVVQGPRRYFMPDKDNPAKQIPVAPRFFLSSSKSKPEPALPEALGIPERRALAASYITGQDNPWFAKAFINRIWYALMGETFYEPIDDIGPERTPKGPEVLDPLADAMAAGRVRHPVAVPHDPQHRGVSAARPLDRQRGRQDALRLELPEPPPCRPGLRCPRPGAGTPPGCKRQFRSEPKRQQRARTGDRPDRSRTP